MKQLILMIIGVILVFSNSIAIERVKPDDYKTQVKLYSFAKPEHIKPKCLRKLNPFIGLML